MDIAKMLDMMSASHREGRENYHLNLGEIISFLEKHRDYLIELTAPHSYRGYYEDLAFEPSVIGIPVVRFLKDIKDNVLGKGLGGYKGGEYLMTVNTPLWRSMEGEASGEAIMDFKIENNVIKPIVKILKD